MTDLHPNKRMANGEWEVLMDRRPPVRPSPRPEYRAAHDHHAIRHVKRTIFPTAAMTRHG